MFFSSVGEAGRSKFDSLGKDVGIPPKQKCAGNKISDIAKFLVQY